MATIITRDELDRLAEGLHHADTAAWEVVRKLRGQLAAAELPASHCGAAAVFERMPAPAHDWRLSIYELTSEGTTPATTRRQPLDRETVAFLLSHISACAADGGELRDWLDRVDPLTSIDAARDRLHMEAPDDVARDGTDLGQSGGAPR